MNGPPNYAAPRLERWLNDKLREVLGEDDASVLAEVDEYTDEATLTRMSDGRQMHLVDESDDAEPDYWSAVPHGTDERAAEGPLDAVIEDLRRWVKG